MKRNKTRKTTQVALYTGAAALMSLAPVTCAQSSVDALLNKLEQKGILTVDEAKELKAENQQDFNNDLNKAMNSKFQMPDWITSYKLYGDFRGRFDEQTADNAAFVDRIRLRYRLRAGLVVNMKDDLQVGFRLGSSDPAGGSYGGNPLSNNSTLQDNGTKKFIYADAAYGKWTPINDGTWLLATTIGKMDQPFQASWMVFDPDYTPEGAALQGTYKINDHHSLVFNSAAFVLDEESKSSRDPFMIGGQLIWNAIWSPKVESSLGVTAFSIVNAGMLTTNNVPYINQGNTRTSSGVLMYNFNPIVASGSVTYKLDSFPLYRGAFPIKVAGEFMDNPAAPSQSNQGYWGGITFGKSGKKGLWDLSYRYQYLEANAWYDQVVDDDNFAYYQSAPVGGGSGIFGGTNMKGHLVIFNYSLTDALSFRFTAYVNDLINPVPGNSQSHALHAMADIMWKF